MTDLEISRALALAIGYKQKDVRRAPDCQSVVEVNRPTVYGDSWHRFEFTCPTVIWPIAERYSLFPSGVSNGDYAAAEKQGYPIDMRWECLRWHYEKIKGKARGWVRYEADTAAKAVALAVIGGDEAQ